MASSNSIGRFFSRLFSSKKFNIVFSLLFAFVFWLIIVIDQNPTRERTFSDVGLSLTLENTVAAQQGLEIVSDVTTPKFSVTFSGPNYVVSALTRDSFSLSVDLTQAKAGTNSYKVVVITNGTDPGYEIASITPSTVVISFDTMKDLTLSKPKTDEDTANILTLDQPNVDVADGFVIDPDFISDPFNFLSEPPDGKTGISELVVHGPSEKINEINSAKIVATVDGEQSETVVVSTNLLLCDKDGKILYSCIANGEKYDIYVGENATTENLMDSGDPAAISVDKKPLSLCIPILKTARIKVKLSPESWTLPSGAKASPETVTVCGKADVIDALDKNVYAELPMPFGTSVRSTFSYADLKLPDAALKLLTDGKQTSIENMKIKIVIDSDE